ncbi:MAG TPA: response regulator [Candidatus Binatia bacterium]|jgi:CheY-like chemotaxis protein|nr:response regulator [Candidatus Binatia bacterium]
MSDTALDVLLVEDNRHDLDVTRQALRRHHLVNDVHVVGDGEAALARLRDGAPHPSLVLLDLDQPGIPGIEVVRRLRGDAHTRAIPLIVLTATRHEPELQECYRLGVSTFIVKPVDFVQFATAVRELGFRWRLLLPER